MTVDERLSAAAVALGLRSGEDPAAVLVAGLRLPSRRASFLLLAVLSGRIPTSAEIIDFARSWRLDGLEPSLRRARRRAPRSLPEVRVHGGVIVDLTDTAASRYTTGIQRVALETIRSWTRSSEDMVLVSWDRAGHVLKTLDPSGRRRVLGSEPTDPQTVIIPFGATFVLPEISVMGERTARIQSIAEYSGSRSIAIGFDAIPVTTAETTGLGMPGAFSAYLAALARFDEVLPISEAAAVEYRGWKEMLGAAGLDGPAVTAITLPSVGTTRPHEEQVWDVSAQLGLSAEQTVILAVGSHEPRKNHLALMHAAELAWRQEREFVLVMVGGNSWNTAAFDALLEQLRARGRSIITLSGVPDETVWALYARARFSVFPSLNEGFGLPVAESLAIGTPVITSDFGSMRAIGEGYGAMCIDPRDIDSLASAMMRLLDDDELLAGLVREADSRPAVTWDTYAAEIWRRVRASTVAQSS